MNVTESIKRTLSRRESLEKMIENRKSALSCNAGGTNSFVVKPSNEGSGYSFNLDWSDVQPLIENNISILQPELDGINKKLEAIGALMGVEQ